MARIITFDIETAPHKAWTFPVWKANILAPQIIDPTRMLSWSAKWNDEKTIHYSDVFEEGYVEQLYGMLSEADVIVGYNHKKFDMRHVNREFLLAGLPPLPPFAHIDMLKEVKKRYDFPHYRLDYVAGVLLGEHKIETGGFELWPQFMAGNKAARATMRKYNKFDVHLTDRLYTHLAPHITGHPHTGPVPEIYDHEEAYVCPVCNSDSVYRERTRRTRCQVIRVAQCADCGHWFDGARRKI